MEISKFDIVEAEIKLEYQGSVQGKIRPFLVVSNSLNNIYSPILIVMPLTSVLKKKHLPVHTCIEAKGTGLKRDSMLLAEQPMTICKSEVKKKIGSVENKEEQKLINKACLNAFFYGETVDFWEVLA